MRGLLACRTDLDQAQVHDGAGGEGGLEHLCSMRAQSIMGQPESMSQPRSNQSIHRINSSSVARQRTSASSRRSTASCNCAAARTSVLNDGDDDNKGDGAWMGWMEEGIVEDDQCAGGVHTTAFNRPRYACMCPNPIADTPRR